MAAILRVKRRNDDEPLNALVITCKRRKTAENEEAEEAAASDPLTTVLKFAGTVKNQEADVVDHLVKTLGKDELKTNYKRHAVNVLDKIREKTKQASIENRYKVINCNRSLDTSHVDELEDTVTVIDVEDSVSCSIAAKDPAKNDDAYVYDLYYTQTGDDLYFDDKLSVHMLDQELVFDTYRDNGHSENECESEDSNSESNWRNDYPDSDHSEGSVSEDDIRNAVKDMRLDDCSDLSSEDDFVFAVNEQDVEKYGFTYARYKARVARELDGSDSNSDSEYSEPEERNDTEGSD